jgi:uncharacterized 2Fe-2S/4Fe-4S cluster protein (DUF4445 family)
MVLGMIPDCDLAEVAAAGNAAGTGARIALLDSTSRATIEQLVDAAFVSLGAPKEPTQSKEE